MFLIKGQSQLSHIFMMQELLKKNSFHECDLNIR